MTCWSYYEKYRNNLIGVLRAAIIKYHHKQLQENQDSQKSQWSKISTILDRTNNVNKSTITLYPLYDDKATSFNNHFIRSSTFDIHMRYSNSSSKFSKYLCPVQHPEVKYLLNELKPTASYHMGYWSIYHQYDVSMIFL